MAEKRIVYQNWIVERGSDLLKGPSKIEDDNFINLLSIDESFNSEEKKTKIQEAVNEALKKLTENEREFIIRFYFMGESYQEISERSNREIYKLSALHNRAFRKLKKLLGAFVEREYGISSKTGTACSVCNCVYVDEINALIKKRDKKRTWKPVLKILKEKYDFSVTTPQILIGHEKYHIPD